MNSADQFQGASQVHRRRKPMFTLSGYTIKEKIFEGARSQIFRGTRVRDGLAVMLKVPAATSFSIRESLRFQHEYSLARVDCQFSPSAP